jgi:predicted Zn-dependent protease with MMP-like domain
MYNMDDDAFRFYVERGIGALPSWVKEELTNVVFLVEDEPNERQRIENDVAFGETLLGLYEGVPLSERGNESPLLPDIITIFMKPILREYQTEKDIRECIENTIWHEVAHYFGHDEEWVEKEEVKRGKLV